MSRSRMITLLLPVLVLALPAQAIADSARPSKTCAKGQTTWKLEGKPVCARAPRLAPQSLPTAQLGGAAWAKSITTPIRNSRKKLIPRSLRRGVPALRKQVGRQASRAIDMAKARGTTARERRAGAAANAVLGTLELPNKTVDAPDGTTIEATGKATKFEDGSIDLAMQFDLTKGGQTVRLKPNFDDLIKPEATIACPTAAGEVFNKTRSSTGGTAIVLRGKNVIKAVTENNAIAVSSRGQVGRDAHLASVVSDVVFTIKRYERGAQSETTIKGTVKTASGTSTLIGIPSAEVRLRYAGSTAKEEAAAEKMLAKAYAQEPTIAKLFGKVADDAATDLKKAEPTWYNIPNKCADIYFAPGEGQLKKGQHATVQGFVKATAGGDASGDIAINEVSHGSFVAGKSTVDPGSPADFTATGGEPDQFETTVLATVIGTSTAGRAQSAWIARGKKVELPTSFTGTISATTNSGAGATWEFSGTGTFTRSSVVTGPDGSTNAWYDLTAGSLTAAKQTIGIGCGWEANGTGGTIDAGDVEVRVLPNGEVVYGMLYDMLIENETYEVVGCPPGTLVPFTGNLDAVLNARRPGPASQSLRPTSDFHLSATGATDVIGAANQPTVGSWDLTPTF